MRSNVNVRELAAATAPTGRREHIRQAAAIDPFPGAERLPAATLVVRGGLIEAHGKLLRAFRRAVA